MTRNRRRGPTTDRAVLLLGTGARVPVDAATGSGAPKRSGVESELELILENRLERAGLPLGVTQHRFVPGRQYRFDRCWLDRRVAVEVQGGIWSGGRHARGSGIAAECVKLSIAAALGWRVLPVTRDMIESGQAVDLIRQALEIAPVTEE